MNAVGIIPARYASTRLPAKALLDIAGRPMIRHVYERALQALSLADVLVATDDQRIVAAVEQFGGRAVMTSPEHRSGTDRLAEVAQTLAADVIVNIQGDEPLIDPAEIDRLLAPFAADPTLGMATLGVPIRSEEEFADPAAVKVVRGVSGHALYFSRQPIPFRRAVEHARPLKHVGMYAYRRDFLLRFASLPPTPLEQAEGLEQLRALEHGLPILVLLSDHDAIGVDTQADLEQVRELLSRGSG